MAITILMLLDDFQLHQTSNLAFHTDLMDADYGHKNLNIN